MSNKANKDLIIKEVEEVSQIDKEKLVVIDEDGKIKKIDLSKIVTGGGNESCMLVFDHTIPH